MMLEETKNYLMELVIDLHDQARASQDPETERQLRSIADNLSEILKKERDALF